MKAARNLVLGTAAGLMTLGGAQAADLPVKAKAIEYVRICSAYGAGFFYIPGTDTCIKFGGYLRVDTTFNGGTHGQPAWNGDLGQDNRYASYFVSRSRIALTVDTRTATEYGVVRTFGQGDFQFTSLGGGTFNPNSINTSIPVAGAQLLDTAGGGYVAVEYLFIQFAGFTFGKSASAYANPWQGFPGNISSSLLGGQNTDTGTNNIPGPNSAMAFPPASASTIPRCGTAPRSTIWRWRSTRRSTPATPMPASTRPTSSAISASTRPGACSRSRRLRMRSTAPTTSSTARPYPRAPSARPAQRPPRCLKSPAIPTPSGAAR
jgi:hypothetical protein